MLVARVISPTAVLSRVLLIAGLTLGVTTLTGCNKAELDKQTARANSAEDKVKSLEAENTKLKSDLQTQTSRAQTAEGKLTSFATSGSVLVTMIDGKVEGRDGIRYDGGSQVFVRHGSRERSNGTIRFENGKLADGPFSMNRDNGKAWFVGAIKNSRPDGEWIWNDRDGKPENKETWKDGKLVEVAKASVAKDGKVTWTKGAKADRDAWVKRTATTFINLPELVRDTSAASATADASGTTDTAAATPTVAKPKSTPTKAVPKRGA
jgi:outer membrane murein-binding lipoprotein Lpp